MSAPLPLDACVRCGLACPHVEASGVYHCPNCGPPRDVPGDERHCTFAFWLGCDARGLPGRGPLREQVRS